MDPNIVPQQYSHVDFSIKPVPNTLIMNQENSECQKQSGLETTQIHKSSIEKSPKTYEHGPCTNQYCQKNTQSTDLVIYHDHFDRSRLSELGPDLPKKVFVKMAGECTNIHNFVPKNVRIGIETNDNETSNKRARTATHLVAREFNKTMKFMPNQSKSDCFTSHHLYMKSSTPKLDISAEEKIQETSRPEISPPYKNLIEDQVCFGASYEPLKSPQNTNFTTYTNKSNEHGTDMNLSCSSQRPPNNLGDADLTLSGKVFLGDENTKFSRVTDRIPVRRGRVSASGITNIETVFTKEKLCQIKSLREENEFQYTLRLLRILYFDHGYPILAKIVFSEIPTPLSGNRRPYVRNIEYYDGTPSEYPFKMEEAHYLILICNIYSTLYNNQHFGLIVMKMPKIYENISQYHNPPGSSSVRMLDCDAYFVIILEPRITYTEIEIEHGQHVHSFLLTIPNEKIYRDTLKSDFIGIHLGQEVHVRFWKFLGSYLSFLVFKLHKKEHAIKILNLSRCLDECWIQYQQRRRMVVPL